MFDAEEELKKREVEERERERIAELARRGVEGVLRRPEGAYLGAREKVKGEAGLEEGV